MTVKQTAERVMTKLKQKRLEAVNRMMLSHGIEYSNKVFMSFWDMADNLNNCWHAEDFVRPEHCELVHGKLVAHSFRLSKFFPAIRHAVKDTHIKIRKSYKNKSEHLIMVAK